MDEGEGFCVDFAEVSDLVSDFVDSSLILVFANVNQVLHVLQRVIGELAAVVLRALHQLAQAFVVCWLYSKILKISIRPKLIREYLHKELVSKYSVIEFVSQF